MILPPFPAELCGLCVKNPSSSDILPLSSLRLADSSVLKPDPPSRKASARQGRLVEGDFESFASPIWRNHQRLKFLNTPEPDIQPDHLFLFFCEKIPLTQLPWS